MWSYVIGGLVAGAAAIAYSLFKRDGGDLTSPLAPAPPGDAPATSPKNAAQHKAARAVVAAALTALLGREPTAYEMQYGHGVVWLESNYGTGWKGSMVGSNNWGAVQCSSKAAMGGVFDDLYSLVAEYIGVFTGELPLAVAALYEVMTLGGACIPYQDSFADGTKYSVSFMSYPTPEDGAKDALRHVFIKRPRTAAALVGKYATAFRASFAMRRERYYEGFCPGASKQYGGSAVRASLSNPDKDAATRACQRETVEAHAKRIHSIALDVAGACGDQYAIPLGTYEDAERWYHETYPDAGPLPPSASPAPATTPAAAPAAATTPAAAPVSKGVKPWERFGPVTYEMTSITLKGHTLRVTRIPAYAMVNGQYTFPPFSLVDAREYIDLSGEKLYLATADVLDAMHLQGWFSPPIVSDKDWQTTGFYNTDANMNTDALVIEFGRRWTRRFKDGPYTPALGPVANCSKPVILDNAALGKLGYEVIRGYYTERPTDGEKQSGKVIIGPTNPYNKRTIEHTKGYKDLSGGAVLVEVTTGEGKDYRALVESGELGNEPFKLDMFWKAGLA